MDRACKVLFLFVTAFYTGIRLLVALSFGGVVASLFETKAASAAPFTCSPNVYLSQGPNSGQDLYDLTFPGGVTNLGAPIRPSGVTGSQGTFNAIGFREVDGFIYGLDRDENLIRIESDGQHVSLGVPTGLPLLPNGGNGSNYVAGTVGPDGLYYVLSQTGADVVHVIDVDLEEVIADIPRPRSFNGADFVIDAQGHFAYLYSTQGEETRRLSLTNDSGVTQGTVQSFGGSTGESGTYGAAYLDANNRFFISNNDSNNIYEIDLAINSATGLPSGAPVLVATGSFGVDRNDGAFCPGAEFPVGAPPTNVVVTAFIDVNGNDVHDSTEPLYEGADAELEAGGVVFSTATTDTAGRGRLNNLSGGSNRRIRLRRNGRLVAEKSNITVPSGTTTEVLIPIDPSGKIYDADTRDLIAGATVTMTDASGAALPAVCFSPNSQQGQVTAADGFYRFDIVPGADTLCPAIETEYRIEVSATGFDAPPSSAIAPQAGPYNPIGTTTNEIVPNTDRPVGGEPTTYYTSFLLGPGDPDVVNNHIALDATSSNPLASLTPFTCTGDFYQIHASPSAVSRVDLINGNFSTLGNTGEELRATGLDPSTGIAYAIGRDTNVLFAIGNDGTVVNLGPVTDLPARNYATGDFGPNGYFYIRENGNNRPLVAVDVNAVAVVEEYDLAAGSINPSTADIAFNPADGSFYTVESSQNDADLLRITLNDSPTNPTFSVVELGKTGISTRGNGGNNVFGAMYADNQGSVFGIRNRSGLMYQFDIGTGAPLIVGRAASTAQNDGFFCSDAVNVIPSDFGDAQTDGTVVDGITTNYGEASQARASDGLFIGTQAPTPEDSNVNASDNADGDANEEAVLVDAVRSETSYTASVSVLNDTGSEAFLCGFIDAGATDGFNGVFDTTSERVCVAVPTSGAAQDIDLDFTGLDFNAAPGSSTFLRLRLSNVQSEAEAPTGTGAAIGEVEDYVVGIEEEGFVTSPFIPDDPTALCSANWYRWTTTRRQFDSTRSPVNPTTHGFSRIPTNFGANMWYQPNRARVSEQLGISSLSEPAESNGDTGEIFYGIKYYEMEPNTSAVLPIRDPGLFEGHAFAAFDSNGNQLGRFPTVANVNSGLHYVASFNDNGPQINQNGDVKRGASWSDNVNFQITVPADGKVYVHYIIIDETTGSRGAFQYCAQDYSDAPSSYGLTRHNYDLDLRLGVAKDVDILDFSATGTAAIGDDNDGDGDNDEDGITIPALTQGQIATISAEVTGAGGLLQGWIDFDGSGTFEASEQVAANLRDDGAGGDVTADDGTITFDVAVPDSAVTTQTFARFRWSTTAGLDATTAAPDGEVEDYTVTIEEAPRVFSCSADVDIWYGNDESGSVDADEFLDALDFVYQVTDEFYHSAADGAQSGIIGWGSDPSPTDIIVPISETLFDQDDSGLMSDPGGPIVDGDGLGIREAYSVRASTSTGTILARATNRLANLINGSNGRRTGIPQVAVILTDAPASQINNEGLVIIPENHRVENWTSPAFD